MRTAVVVAGGGELSPAAAASLPADALVIGADSGAAAALALGLSPHHVVGDLDSLAPEVLTELERRGVEVHRHPVDKDATDLELAMELAVTLGAGRLVVLGAWGERLDHLAAEMALLASDRWVDLAVQARLGPAEIHVVRRSLTVRGPAGQLLTLLATGGPATGVRTTGLRYPLAGEVLVPGSSRGVSNELLGGTATVSVEAGVLLAIAPLPGSA